MAEGRHFFIGFPRRRVDDAFLFGRPKSALATLEVAICSQWWRSQMVYVSSVITAYFASNSLLFYFLTACGKVLPMSVRMRHTSSHTKNRRSHHALKNTNIVVDKASGALRLPHRLDETTGMYRGKLIVPERKKTIKKDEKRRAKNDKEKDALALEAPEVKKEKIESKDKVKKQSKTQAPVKVRTKARSGTEG